MHKSLWKIIMAAGVGALILACDGGGAGADRSHNDKPVDHGQPVYEVRFSVETNASEVHLDDFKGTDAHRDDRFETIAPEWRKMRDQKVIYWRFEYNALAEFDLYAKASVELGRDPREKSRPPRDLEINAKFVEKDAKGNWTVRRGGCTPKSSIARTVYPGVLRAEVYCLWERRVTRGGG